MFIWSYYKYQSIVVDSCYDLLSWIFYCCYTTRLGCLW